MLGAIAGDIIGSRFEARPIKSKDFELFTAQSVFTDDSVLSIAIADSLMSGEDYAVKLKEYFRRYPYAGFGGMFRLWATSEDCSPYNSFGNGSAMRVSPVGWFFDQENDILEQAEKSAVATHNHPEGIKGAQAVALSLYLARKECSKHDIKIKIQNLFKYDLSNSLDKIRPNYKFEVTCQDSVPQALLSFLESSSYEDAVRNAVSLGGDSDTQACIAGAVAEAFYGELPEYIASEVFSRLDKHLAGKVREFILFLNKDR
jgi:ADP-ribosylglycohydrolase